jgi:hypothetical protein
VVNLVNPGSCGRAAGSVSGTPDAEACVALKSAMHDNREGPGVREDARRCAWIKASKGNPKSGSGMKQVRKVARGARRREGAKP